MATKIANRAELRAKREESSPQGSQDEKQDDTHFAELTVEVFSDHDVSNPFPPFPGETEETHQLTIRAIAVGCVLGAVVGASNIYLGLKTGAIFGSQLFGSILGFAILKPISKALPESGLLGRLFGGYFGPKENCTVQSAATAAGGLGILAVSAIPAMYRLNLLSDPREDFGRLIALVFSSAFFGVCFVIPLRKYFIVHQKLTFPTPAATAYTIRSLHGGKSGALAARKKALALFWTLIASLLYKVLNGYAPGILLDWHIGWTLYRLGFASIISLDNYGWWIEITSAFFGAGMLSGLNASWSFFAGSILAWGIIAPLLIKNGLAVGISVSDDYPLVSYLSLSFGNPEQFIARPSPRYWLLWPGIFIMLLYSFTEVILSLIPMITFKAIKTNRNPVGWFRGNKDNSEDEDHAPIQDRVPTSWWAVGVLLSTISSCAILGKFFSMNVGEALLAQILGFLFSFIAVQSSGQTDINPVTTIAKVSQLIFGGIAKAAHRPQVSAQMLNLSAGVVAAGSASQASDMTGDLKTGYLLRAKPRNQFIAQLCGAFVAVFVSVSLFVLFAKASPCIINPPESGVCPYGAPSVAAWAAVSIAVTSPKLPIPPTSAYTAIGLGVASVLTLVIKVYVIPKKYWPYVPNWNAVGLGFIVPQAYYALAMAIGSVVCYVWSKKNAASYDMYMFAVAAGLIAGEGLGGVFQALLAVTGIDGSRYGTAIGCPGFQFCG